MSAGAKFPGVLLAAPLEPLGFRPGRLWSLWDMHEIVLGPLLEALTVVTAFAQTAAIEESGGRSMRIEGKYWDELSAATTALKSIGETADLPIITEYADRLLQQMLKARPWSKTDASLSSSQVGDIGGSARRLQDLVRAVLGTTEAVILGPQGGKLWAPKLPLFGASFQDRFPCAQYDLEEAAKCLAVGRYTASVFHLMRIMETGLHAIHAALGIQTPLTGNERNWGNILGRIKTAVGLLPKGQEKDSFQENYALLDAAKDAWRNNTMHVALKYSPDEVERIYQTVKGFMMKLSERMDENGIPAP